MIHHCLTVNYSGRVRALNSPCHVCAAYLPDSEPNPPPLRQQYNAVWDTGATGSVITQQVADDLGLQPTGMTVVHGIEGESNTETYLVNITLPNGVMFHGLKVTKAKLLGFDVLIGMDVMGAGDFAITNFDEKSVMTFRVPSKGVIDFSAEQRKEIGDAARKALIKNRPNAPRKKKKRK